MVYPLRRTLNVERLFSVLRGPGYMIGGPARKAGIYTFGSLTPGGQESHATEGVLRG